MVIIASLTQILLLPHSGTSDLRAYILTYQSLSWSLPRRPQGSRCSWTVPSRPSPPSPPLQP